MAPSKSGPPVAPYAKDEKVLCFHHDLLYEAKVLDTRPTEDGSSWQCKIHYKGWKATWDDWVPQDRVMKFNEDNKELAAQLHQEMKKMAQKPKQATTTAGGKKLGGRANGSDFGSGRGSEERHASVAAPGGGGGRGGPRRNRDYDLEQMAPTIVSTVKLRAKPLARKSIKSVSALRDDSENSTFTNGNKKPKAKPVKIVPVPPLGVRRSGRERCPAEPYDRSIIDSGNLRVTKPRLRINGKNSDWANPKSEHWDVLKFLSDDSLVPVTNLDARPPKDFQFIFNNSVRDPGHYRPDKSTHDNTPKPKAPPINPKLQAHIKNGTANKLNRLYYGEYEPGQINPIAGRLFDDNQLPPARLKRRRALPQSYDEASAEEIVKPAPKRIKLTLKKASKKPSEKVPEKATEMITDKKIHFHKEMSKISEVRERPIKTTKKMLPRIAKTNIVMEQCDFNYLQEESFHVRPSINLVIPDHIKAILVDDWENVTKSQQLVPLPHKKSVNQILNDWLEFEKPKRPVGSPQADLLEEIVAGLKEYFERCLGRILLYRFERQQYTDFRQLWDDDSYEQNCASDTYGAEHLCRLLVTLPELIAQTNMDLQSVNRLREELGKLTNWIGKNAKEYFVNEYETPPADYVEKARSNN